MLSPCWWRGLQTSRRHALAFGGELSVTEPLATPGSASVVLVTHYYPQHGGGVEIVALELARRLARDGVSLTWFSSATDAPPDVEGIECRPVAAWNFLERRFGIPWPIWNPACVPRLWRAIGAARAVHVHDSLYMGNVIAACIARMRRKRLVVTQHIGLVPYKSAVLRGLMAFANATIAAPLLRRAGCVVFISTAVRKYFDGLCRWSTPPHLIPNGVDTDLYQPPGAERRRAARASLQLRENETAFVFVGRFVEKKGLHLIEQFARRTPNARWLLAGDGPIDPDRWELSNVRVFRDRRRESLRELLWAADALVLPSVGEGFPLVVQEAIAAGLPCLVTSDTLEGFPESAQVLLSEPLGADAEGRWLKRLESIHDGTAQLAKPTELAEFAHRHWSWQEAASFYRRELTAG